MISGARFSPRWQRWLPRRSLARREHSAGGGARGRRPAGNDSAQEEPAKAPPKHPAKHAKKAHAKKDAHAKKRRGPQEGRPRQEGRGPRKEALSKPSEDSDPFAKSKGHDSSSKGKKTKKTASRSASSRKKAPAKKADSDAPQRPCLGSPVTVDRGGLEGQSLALVDCNGAARDVAREQLSLLARPWSAPRPRLDGPGNEHGHGHARPKPTKGTTLPAGEIAPGVRLVDKGLLVRVDAIARHFPGAPSPW